MDATASALASSPKLLDQVRGKFRLKHYSLRTENNGGQTTILSAEHHCCSSYPSSIHRSQPAVHLYTLPCR